MIRPTWLAALRIDHFGGAAGVVAALVINTMACGTDSSPIGGPDPDPEVCSASWQVIYSPRQELISLAPSVLRWHDGRLFTKIEAGTARGITSVPDIGGEPVMAISDASIFDFWIEDDQLLRAASGPSQKVDGLTIAPLLLYRSPIAGGPSEVVLKTHIFDTFVDQLVSGWALDAQAMYWVRNDADGSGWGAWRAGRDGGGDQKLGTLTTANVGVLDTVVPIDDHLIIYNSGSFSGGTIFSVPTAGGDAVSLPSASESTVVGVMQDGTVLLQSYTGGANGQKRSDHYALNRLRPGAAAPEPFWLEKPPAAYPIAGWDDGAHGALLSVSEWGTDDSIHTTVWSIDADGHGVRLACDSVIQSYARVAAVAPDAVYLVVQQGTSYWQLVRVPRGG